jgi:hypothetical protein
MALGCRAFFVFGHSVIFPIIHLAGLLIDAFYFHLPADIRASFTILRV